MTLCVEHAKLLPRAGSQCLKALCQLAVKQVANSSHHLLVTNGREIGGVRKMVRGGHPGCEAKCKLTVHHVSNCIPQLLQLRRTLHKHLLPPAPTA
eukprot:3784044-Prymnesium_polylepis.1